MIIGAFHSNMSFQTKNKIHQKHLLTTTNHRRVFEILDDDWFKWVIFLLRCQDFEKEEH